MRCSNCHEEIPNDSKTCPKCDTILASFFEDVVLTKKQKRKLFFHKMMFPIMIITMILIIDSILIIKFIEKENIIKEPSYVESDKIYESTNKYYKYILNSKEKEIYDEIMNAIKNNEETIEIDLKKYGINQHTFAQDTIRNIKHVISMDHPELINFGAINIAEINENSIKLVISYTMSKEKIEEANNQMLEKIEQIKENTKELSEYEKVKYVFNYFDENTNIINIKNTQYFTAYSCMVLNECTMNGITSAVQIVFSKIGIDSIIVTGAKMNKYYEWNIVKIENKYYNYDQTEKKLFFKDDNYTSYHKKVLPNINGKKYMISR